MKNTTGQKLQQLFSTLYSKRKISQTFIENIFNPNKPLNNQEIMKIT